MTDPFAAALDALFNAPGSAAAVYQPQDGDAVEIRVIHGQPSETSTFGGVPTVQGTKSIEIRRSEVAQPAPGDLVQIGDDTFELLGDPLLDLEGLTWFCGADRA